MATASVKGLKPYHLEEDVTFSSYGKWQSNMLYCLNKETNWQRFLKPVKVDNVDTKWEKVTAENITTRGFTDDAGEAGMRKEQKAMHLNAMLEYIAQFVPHFLTHELIHETTSMKSAWNIIRQYYTIQQSESNFLKLSTITWEGIDKERPERLYRRVLSHITDNLLSKDGGLTYNNEIPTSDEMLSPTVERLAVHRWLELMDPGLPMLVARHYATDLQSKSLKDLQPMIASAAVNLLDLLKQEEVIANRAANAVDALNIDYNEVQATHVSRFTSKPNQRQSYHSHSTPNHKARNSGNSKPRLQCILCQGWGRQSMGHTMATCRYISDGDRQDIARKSPKSFRVNTDDHGMLYEDDYEDQE